MIHLRLDGGNDINAAWEWHIGLFTPSYVVIYSAGKNLKIGDVIDLYEDSDDTTTILFKGKIVEKKEERGKPARFIAYGETGRFVQDYRHVVLYGKTNVDILNTIIGLYQGYNWVSNVTIDTSNITAVDVKYFVQKSYTIYEIYNLLFLSNMYYSDKYNSGEWVVEPIELSELQTSSGELVICEGKNNGQSVTIDGNSLTAGNGYLAIQNLKYDKSRIINKIIVEGNKVEKSSSESGTVVAGSGDYTGYGYIKTLHKIAGNVDLRLYDSNGKEYTDATAQILNESGVVLVDSQYENYTYKITYSWYDTFAYMDKDENSIEKYGEKMKIKKINASTMEELQTYAKNILSIYANPPMRADIALVNFSYTDANGNSHTELDLGNKFYMCLNNGTQSSPNYYCEEVIVYEKIYKMNKWYYKIGNVGTILGFVHDIAEKLTVDLGKLQIANIIDYGTDDVVPTFKWYSGYIDSGGISANSLGNIHSGVVIASINSKYSYGGNDGAYVTYVGTSASDYVKWSLSDISNAEYGNGGSVFDLNFSGQTAIAVGGTSGLIAKYTTSPSNSVYPQNVFAFNVLGSWDFSSIASGSSEKIIEIDVGTSEVLEIDIVNSSGAYYLQLADTSGDSVKFALSSSSVSQIKFAIGFAKSDNSYVYGWITDGSQSYQLKSEISATAPYSVQIYWKSSSAMGYALKIGKLLRLPYGDFDGSDIIIMKGG